MKAASGTSTLLQASVTCLVCGLAPAFADTDPPMGCDGGVSDVEYGDGSDGDYEVHHHTYYELPPNKNYRNFTVGEGAILDTRGRTLRVCGTLTNLGTIRDSSSGGTGGDGGTGGQGGLGIYPHLVVFEPEQGDCGDSGAPSSDSLAGDGGDGGGGGGGGGSAWNSLCPVVGRTDGGEGGDGGRGGDGGGHVIIYAWALDNSEGIIHAGGDDGDDGQSGEAGLYKSYTCWLLDTDQASGEGGGGAGGDGGDGGTVEIYSVELLGWGDIHALGGRGGEGSPPGGLLCDNLDYPSRTGQYYEEGALGGCSAGGGGESDVGTSCGPHRGAPGDPGDDGEDGRVLARAGVTDLLHYELHLTFLSLDENDPDYGKIRGSNIMTIQCGTTPVDTFCFRFDSVLDDSPVVSISPTGDDPWTELTWEYLADWVTVVVELDNTYASEQFYLRVDYEGYPQVPAEHEGGMHFETHGEGADGAPIVVTSVSPWYAYRWIPVKDESHNSNSDEATADFYVTVPRDVPGLIAVSNGVHVLPDEVTEDGIVYHWRTEYDTPAYLFCVAVTNYHTEAFVHNGVPIELYVWPEDETDAWGRTIKAYDDSGEPHPPTKVEKWSIVTEMLDLFTGDDDPDDNEIRFGPYPFANEKYAVYQWGEHGGMEHQTATGVTNEWFAGRIYARMFPDVDWKMSHELAHSWWGDLITCANWNDLWLNEGFASFAETFWVENQYDSNRMPYRLFNTPIQALRRYVRSAHWPGQSALSERVYVETVTEDDPRDVTCSHIPTFRLLYQKAPRVLHMLRHLVDPVYCNEELEITTPNIFKILRRYKDNTAADGYATTTDFQTAAEEICDEEELWDDWPEEYRNSLGWFFDQWIYHGGAPAYRYAQKVDSGAVGVRVRQTQQMWYSSDPLFVTPIDIYLHGRQGCVERHTVWNDDVLEEIWLSTQCLPPLWIEFDPNHWLLRRWAVPRTWSLVTDMGETSDTIEPMSRINSLTQLAVGVESEGESQAFLYLVQPHYGHESGLANLGTLGGAWSRSYDVNEAGQIVGASADGDGNTNAFIWLPQGDFELDPGIHELAGDEPYSVARGINDFGQVIGYTGAGQSEHHAVVWQYEGAGEPWAVVSLPSLGGDRTQAWAINNSGQIAGWSETVGSEQHAVVWEYGGQAVSWTITDLGTVGASSAAHGINEDGDVVGREGDTAMAWRRQQQGLEVPRPFEPTPLPTSKGRDFANVAYGINDAGCVVGESAGRAAMWLLEPAYGLPTGMTDLNDHPAFASVATCRTLKVAWDINDAGQIVGRWDADDPPGDPHIFLMDLASIADCNGSGILDACDLFGDDDGNGVVDLNDYAVFAGCMSGPGAAADDSCLCMLDANHDHDVDLADFAAFQRGFTAR